jgi:flagellar hook assembly protein FlgD
LASFLSQNSPNPFSASTRIVFGLREAADVRVRIYDVAGRLVRDLVDSHFAASRHVVAWDGRDDAGRVVASGMYFYRIDAGTFVQTRKLLLMR